MIKWPGAIKGFSAKCKYYKALYGFLSQPFNSSFHLQLTHRTPLCIAYIINLSPIRASQDTVERNKRAYVFMLPKTVRLWWNEEQWKDLGMGSNMIMQGLAGATFPITAALVLIKTQPPLSTTIHAVVRFSSEGWLRCALFVLWVVCSRSCRNNHIHSVLH